MWECILIVQSRERFHYAQNPDSECTVYIIVYNEKYYPPITLWPLHWFTDVTAWEAVWAIILEAAPDVCTQLSMLMYSASPKPLH